MRKSKFPLCPICNQEIEAPHLSCQIPCVECGELLLNLDCYYVDECDYSIFYRFCDENCKSKYLEKHIEGGR
jgi:hypothetical protein